MSPSDESVEIEVAFDEGLLAGVDQLRRAPGYESRSEVVAAAIETVVE